VGMTSMTLFYNLDVILVKHYFDAFQAGYYVAASLLGKVLFFASIAISMVMFSKLSELYALKKPTRHLLYKSMFLVFLCSAIITFVYFVFPKFIIDLFFGAEYYAVMGLIGLFGIIMTLFSLSYLIVFYFLGIHKTRFIYVLVFFNVLQIILLILYHSSLLQVLYILLGTITFLFLSLLFLLRISKR
jgi:O-antigen/teichoic acid export membrane protein